MYNNIFKNIWLFKKNFFFKDLNPESSNDQRSVGKHKTKYNYRSITVVVKIKI